MGKKKNILNGLLEVFKETLRILCEFVKPLSKKDNLIEIPTGLRQQGRRLGWFELIVTATGVVFSYLLIWANAAIEKKLIVLGIGLFVLSKARSIAEQSLRMMLESEKTAYSTVFDTSVIEIGQSILAKTINKVRIYDEQNHYYRILTKHEVINSVKKYIQAYWNLSITHRFQLMEMGITIVSLIAAVYSNSKIDQKIFIPTIFIFCIISFMISAACSRNNRETYKKNRKERNERDSIMMDIMEEGTEIVKEDLSWRLKEFSVSAKKSKENIKENRIKNNAIRITETILEFASQLVLILLYVVAVIKSGEEVTIATVAELIANLAIVETALRYISKMGYTLTHYSEDLNVLVSENDRVSEILNVYKSEDHRIKNARRIKDLNIEPFKVSYSDENSNNKPFTLISEEPLGINSGEVAVLYGPSGTGKSTLINLITEKIAFTKNVEIPSTSRCMVYDEKLRLGSFPIFQEIFCNAENPDLDKMKFILQEMHIWQEIATNCKEVWEWMKEHKFNALSNGQKQRLILAKMLYHLDENIDIIVFDEATSGLDEKSTDVDNADAEKILKFLIQYSNKDKKRIIVISTHQNIDGVEAHLKSKYHFKKFIFNRGEKASFVRELKN